MVQTDFNPDRKTPQNLLLEELDFAKRAAKAALDLWQGEKAGSDEATTLLDAAIEKGQRVASLKALLELA